MSEPRPGLKLLPSFIAGNPSVELSSHRTGLSFQRTRMSADRTLMSVMRTSISLISFGFAIFQFLASVAREQGGNNGAARRFGVTLVVLGIVTLLSGIAYHLSFMDFLRSERWHLKEEGLLHTESSFPHSTTLFVAVLVLVVGLLAVAGMAFHSGPFLD